jgi:cell division septum initiation protein DivIVA
MDPSRPRSSIYSNQFALEDFLDTLEDESRKQDTEVIEKLTSRRDQLREKVEAWRSISASLHEAISISADLAAKLLEQHREARAQAYTERAKWLANCTAI